MAGVLPFSSAMIRGECMRTAILVASAFLAGGSGVFGCANGATDSSQGDGGGGPPSSDSSPGGNPDAFTLDGSPVLPSGDASGDTQGSGGLDAGHAFDAAEEPDVGPTCVASDAGCATGNPGACGPGTLECDGGAAVCAPVLSSQACYSGPPATRNVGVCKDGTQSCVGALGACMGEVLPATYEDCFNALDDNCDGVVNDGCPASVALGGDRPLTGAGGAGGGPQSLHCPAGAFVTRVDSWFDDADKHASGVSIYCATPSLLQGASSYSILLTPNTPAPYATATGANSPTNERHDDCGITGLTAITYTVGLADTYVEGLGAHCGTSAVTLNPDDTMTFSFSTNGDVTYNTWAGQPGTFFDQACNPNEVVVGYVLHTGSWMDNVQPICAPLVVNYK